MAKYKIGDKVKIIHSPYYNDRLKKGAISTIADIKNDQFGKRWRVYILDTPFGGSFHEQELEKMNDKEE